MAIKWTHLFRFFAVSLLALSLATLFFELTRKGASSKKVPGVEIWLLSGYVFIVAIFLLLVLVFFPEKDKSELTHPVEIVEGAAVVPPLPEPPIG